MVSSAHRVGFTREQVNKHLPCHRDANKPSVLITFEFKNLPTYSQNFLLLRDTFSKKTADDHQLLFSRMDWKH